MIHSIVRGFSPLTDQSKSYYGIGKLLLVVTECSITALRDPPLIIDTPEHSTLRYNKSPG